MWFERQYDIILEWIRGATTQGKQEHEDVDCMCSREEYTEGDGGVLEGSEEHQCQQWNTERGVYSAWNEIVKWLCWLRCTYPSRGAWKGGYRAQDEIVEQQSRLMSNYPRVGVQKGGYGSSNIIEKHLCWPMSASPTGGVLKEKELDLECNREELDQRVPILAGLCQWVGRGMKLPTNVQLISAVASRVKCIIGDGWMVP